MIHHVSIQLSYESMNAFVDCYESWWFGFEARRWRNGNGVRVGLFKFRLFGCQLQLIAGV